MTTPKHYQIRAVKRMNRFRGRTLLADEMGLGKTFEVLLWLQQRADAWPALVVCPKSIKWVWEAEAAHHINTRAMVLSGTKPPRLNRLQTPQLVVINYDILRPWMKYLSAIGFRTLIVDECHQIKNWNTVRFRQTRLIARGGLPHPKRRGQRRPEHKRIKYRFALSGTPLVNRPSELWASLNLVRPDLYPISERREYLDHYCEPELTPWGWKFDGAANLGELHDKLRETLMVRRTKRQVLKELPHQSRYIVPLELDKRQEYTRAANDFLSWLREQPGGIARARRAAKAERLARYGYLLRLAALLKLPSVFDWVDTFLEDTDGKLVLFGVHRNFLGPLHERYNGTSLLVTGKTPENERRLAVREFQQKRKRGPRLFIGNLKACGVGLTLTAATTAVVAELGWTPGEHTQAEKRIDRIGQTAPTSVYYLLARNTIEETLCRLLQKKQADLDAVLDGRSRGNTLNIYDLLEKELLKKGKQ